MLEMEDERRDAEDLAMTDFDKRISSRDKRSFWTLVGLATQNAFNDKAAQFFLIPLAGWLVMMSSGGTSGGTILPYVLGALIVAPFIILSPLAGWLSDSFSKTHILRGSMLLQLAVLALIAGGVALKSLELGIVGFFLLAVQSTLFSPAKKGLVKEMMGSERLGFASGVLEMASVLAICAGQIASGFWFDSRLRQSGDGWDAAMWPLIIVAVAAVPAALLAWTVKVYPSQSKRRFEISILWEHVGQLKELFSDRRLKWSGLGVAFFWFFGGFLNLAAIKLGEQITGGAEGFGSEMAWFVAAASGGVIIGGLIGSLSCRRHIELGLVPIGGLVMVLGCLMMALVPTTSVWIKLWMVVAGIGGALFLVPLNAYLQDVCAPEKRGQVLAGLNLLDCLAGVIAVASQFGLNALGVDFKWQFLGLAVLCLVVTSFSTKLLPQHFVRFSILTVLRVFYRQKVLNAERIPKEGGVLIVPNHMTYIDAFILTGASTRPIRFLMTDEYFKKRGIVRLFLKMFDTVPISDKRAKEAIQKAADAVMEGGVVCIFPEGQLSRTGSMNELKRGYEMIARKAKCPVLPVYMDGLWGSIFSFERGKFLKKMPYRLPYGVTVNWGEPIEAREANTDRVRTELLQLGMQSFMERDQLENPQKTLRRARPSILAGDGSGWRSLLSKARGLEESEQYELVYNGLQLSESHAICRGDVVAIRIDELGALELSLGVLFPVLARLRLIIVSDATSAEELREWNEKYGVASYIGGEKLLAQLKGAGVEASEFYDVGGRDASEGTYPVYGVGGLVVAMSMPHPVARTATNQFQSGWKEGAQGRLLVGYSVGVDGDCEEKKSIFLPKRKGAITREGIDEEGFVLLSD